MIQPPPVPGSASSCYAAFPAAQTASGRNWDPWSGIVSDDIALAKTSCGYWRYPSHGNSPRPRRPWDSWVICRTLKLKAWIRTGDGLFIPGVVTYWFAVSETMYVFLETIVFFLETVLSERCAFFSLHICFDVLAHAYCKGKRITLSAQLSCGYFFCSDWFRWLQTKHPPWPKQAFQAPMNS